MENKITNLEDLKERRYTVLNLPGWGADDVFTVKLKGVRVMDLASKGKIPNPLISTVIDLFKGNFNIEDNLDSIEDIKKINDLTSFFAEVTMVEPTFKEVEKEIGLTDEQKMLIYVFATRGVQAVKPFLAKSECNEPNSDGENLQQATEPVNED